MNKGLKITSRSPVFNKTDMGDYVLIIGKNATDIFKYYNVEEMHGLNLKDAQIEELDKTRGNGVYIYGFTNYDPKDKTALPDWFKKGIDA